MGKGLESISKFLSYVLRHAPESIGLSLDPNGWASVDDLVSKAADAGTVFNIADVFRVVDSNDKKRFALSDDGKRIRASQGHSVKVELELIARQPPESLFHGSATRFLTSIQQQGLIPGSRQFVHLSINWKTAIEVGSRHGRPLVLRIAAKEMNAQGFRFYCSENGIWLTESVQPKFLSVEDTLSSQVAT